MHPHDNHDRYSIRVQHTARMRDRRESDKLSSRARCDDITRATLITEEHVEAMSRIYEENVVIKRGVHCCGADMAAASRRLLDERIAELNACCTERLRDNAELNNGKKRYGRPPIWDDD